MKFMNMKRFASTVLAGTMALSLAVPAMAADETVITAAYKETTLDVTVPADTNATINPYGLPVTLGDSTTVLSGQPITIATPLMIQNKSGVALKVGASVTTTVTGLALATAENGVAGGNAKEVFAEFQAFEAAGIDGASALDPTITNPAWAALKSEDAALKAVLSSTAAATATATGADLVLREGADGMAQVGGIAFVRLSGVAAKNPTTAWEETDKLVATITYSFEPATYTKSAGTLSTPANLSAGAGTARDITLTLPAGVTPNDAGLTWEWATSDTADVTIADTSGSGTYKASITPNTAGTFTVTVSFVGTDGIPYTATSAAITVAA